MTSKHPCALPQGPCLYHSRPHNPSLPQCDLFFFEEDPHGGRGELKLAAVAAVAGLLLKAEGLLEEVAVHASRMNRYAARQLQSRRHVLKMATGQKRMAY